MIITKYIHWKTFIASFCIGLLFIFVIGLERKKIYIYPSPENVDKIIFEDNAHNCFLLEEMEVKCPSNNADIHSIPLQI